MSISVSIVKRLCREALAKALTEFGEQYIRLIGRTDKPEVAPPWEDICATG